MGSTAVIIAYDDSDGWYDHVMPPISALATPRSTRSTAPASAARRRCAGATRPLRLRPAAAAARHLALRAVELRQPHR